MSVTQLLRSLLVIFLLRSAQGQTCGSKPQPAAPKGTLRLMALEGGGFASLGKMNIDIDGYGRAYHPENYTAGALLHLCNAARVYLPDGSYYEGSESNATCVGKFMSDYKHIRDAGWSDPSVGAINWYGVVGIGNAVIDGRTIHSVKPVLQPDGSGFYVSPSSFVDRTVSDVRKQTRYVNPLAIPFAVVPSGLVALGVAMGTFGVAIDPLKKIAVPFVVADGGPRVGEGSVALAYKVAGKSLPTTMTHKATLAGQVDPARILWVFFGGTSTTYDHSAPDQLTIKAGEAFQRWGGDTRLKACVDELTQGSR
jgi:hypothetical protein